MKKFLSILLAVMMVFSSTVSYAAPSLAGVADSAVEYAPVVEDVPAAEDEAEKDTALLSENPIYYTLGRYEFNDNISPFTVGKLSAFRGGTASHDAENGYIVVDLASSTATTAQLKDVNSGTSFVVATPANGFRKAEIRFRSTAHDALTSANVALYAHTGSSLLPIGGNPVSNTVAAIKGDDGWWTATWTSFPDGWKDEAIAKYQLTFTSTQFTTEDTITIDYIRFYTYGANVTIHNDIDGYLPDFSDTLMYGEYSIEQMEKILDPDGVFYDAGYYLAGFAEVDGDTVTFEQDETYELTAIWDRINFLPAGFEFNSEADFTRVQTLGYRNYDRTGYSNNRDAFTSHVDEGYITLTAKARDDVKAAAAADPDNPFALGSDVGFNNITVNAGAGQLEKVAVKVRYSFPIDPSLYGTTIKGYHISSALALAKTSFNPASVGTFGGYYYLTQGAAATGFSLGAHSVAELNGLSANREWLYVEKHATDIPAWKETGLYQIRLDTTNFPDGSTVDVDYIRFIPKDKDAGDNLLVDMSGIVPDFKMVINSTMTVGDVINEIKARLESYTGSKGFKAVTFDGKILFDSAATLDSLDIVDQDTIKVEYGDITDFGYVFTENFANASSHSEFAMTTNDDYISYTATTANGDRRRAIFQGMNIPAGQLKEFYITLNFPTSIDLGKHYIYWGNNKAVQHGNYYDDIASTSGFTAGTEFTLKYDAKDIKANYVSGSKKPIYDKSVDYFRYDFNSMVQNNTVEIHDLRFVSYPLVTATAVSESNVPADLKTFTKDVVCSEVTSAAMICEEIAAQTTANDGTFTPVAVIVDGVTYSGNDVVGSHILNGTVITIVWDKAQCFVDSGTGNYETFYFVKDTTVSSVLEHFSQPGITAVALLKEDGSLLTAEADAESVIEFGIAYKVLYKKSILKSWEFDDAASSTGFTSSQADISFDAGLMITTRNSSTGTYYVNFGSQGAASNSFNIAADAIDDIVYRIKGPANVGTLFVYYDPSQKTQSISLPLSDKEFVDASLKDELGKSVSDFLIGNSVDTLQGFRIQGGNQVLGTKVYYDFVRVIGKESTLVLKLNAGDDETLYVSEFFSDDYVSELLAYVNSNNNDLLRKAVALKFGDTVLSETDTLAQAGVEDFSEIEIVWVNNLNINFKLDEDTTVTGVTTFFANDSVSDVLSYVETQYATGGKAPRALRNGNTILSSDDTLEGVADGTTLEVLWSSNIITAFEFNTEAEVKAIGVTATATNMPSEVKSSFNDGAIRVTAVKNSYNAQVSLPLDIKAGELKGISARLRFIDEGRFSKAAAYSSSSHYWGNANSFTFSISDVVSGQWKDVNETAFGGFAAMQKTDLTKLRWDFYSNASVDNPFKAGDYFEIDYIRFLGYETLPVMVVDMSTYNAKDVVIPYTASMTAEQAIAKIVAESGIDTASYAITAVGGKSGSESVYGILSGADGFVTLDVTNTASVTINANVAGTDLAANMITLPTAPYATSATVAEVMNDIKVSTAYNGFYALAGLSYTADGALLDVNATIESLTTTQLYAIWRKCVVYAGYEFNEAGKTYDIGKDAFRSATLRQQFLDDGTGVLTLDFVTATQYGDIHSGKTITTGGKPVSDVKAVEMRFKVVDGSGADVSKTNVVAHTRLGDTIIDTGKSSYTTADAQGWQKAYYDGSNFASGAFDSIQLGFTNNTAGVTYTKSTKIYIDYIRIISKEAESILTVNMNGYNDDETNKFEFSSATTVKDILSKIASVSGKSPTALINSNGVRFTGNSTIVEVLGAKVDGLVTLAYASDKNVTVTGLSAVGLTDVVSESGVSSATTVGEIVNKLRKAVRDAKYSGTLYVEGVTLTQGGRKALDASKTLDELFGETAVDAPLYAILDEVNILFGSEFDGPNIGNFTMSGAEYEFVDGTLVLTTTGATGSMFLNVGGTSNPDKTYNYLNINIDDIEDIVARVAVSADLQEEYFAVVSTDAKADKTYGGQFTSDGSFQIISFKDDVSNSFVEGSTLLKTFRFLQYRENNDSIHCPAGTTVTYDYVRVIGKPLPEVDVVNVSSDKGSFAIASLTDIDYTSTMIFKDLADKLQFTGKNSYKLVGFEVDGVVYGLSTVISNVIKTSETVTVTPVLEQRFTTTYKVDFGTQADYFSKFGVEAPSIEVADNSKTVADLEKLVRVDEGSMKFVHLVDEQGNKLASDKILELSASESDVVTYTAVWESYTDRINTLYSVEFDENTGYIVGNPGHDSLYSKVARDVDEKYLYADEDGDAPLTHNEGFVTHENGAITLNFDASPLAKAKAQAASLPAGVSDANFELSGLSNSNEAFIPAGTIEKIVIRMKYHGELPTVDTKYSTVDYNPDKGYATSSPSKFYAPFVYYVTDTVTVYGQKSYSKAIDVSNAMYRNKWVTVEIPASAFELDDEPLRAFRLDPYDFMLDGSKLSIDFIRFVTKATDANGRPIDIVDLDDVKSLADNKVSALAHGIRVEDDKDTVNKNGVRVKGQYSNSLVTNKLSDIPYATDLGMLFASAERLEASELTMENFFDVKFNTSSRILTAYSRQNGEDKTRAVYSDDDLFIFSAVLYNIPVKNYYTPFYVRPFAKYAGSYIYGTPVEVSFMGIANQILESHKGETEPCEICAYINECDAKWDAYQIEKESASAIIGKFSSVLANPSTLMGSIVIPTELVKAESASAILKVFNVSTNAFEEITVNTANTWPAIIKNGALNSSYTLKPCAVVTENGTKYIMSLGYSRDGESGQYTGIEKSDVSILDDEADTDGTNMFIKNTFRPESPFRKVTRYFQRTDAYANKVTSGVTPSYFLGDFSFGSYNFKSNIWSNVAKEFEAGKTAFAQNYSKVVAKYNYADGSSDWVVYDKDAIALVDNIDFATTTYIVANDPDNLTLEDNTGVTNTVTGESYDSIMEGEKLVFLFGEVNMPAQVGVEFNDATGYTLTNAASSSISDGVLTISANKSSSDSGRAQVNVSDVSIDASLYNTIMIKALPSFNGSSDNYVTGYVKFTRKTGNTSKDYKYSFNMKTSKATSVDGMYVYKLDMSNVTYWHGTIENISVTFPIGSSITNKQHKIDFVRFLATGYDSATLPKYNADGVTGIFESFSNGFNIDGMEGTMYEKVNGKDVAVAFDPTLKYFETSEGGIAAKDAYEEAAKDSTEIDKTYADWSVAPIYTFDYYGVYNNIIKKSDEFNTATNKKGDKTFGLSTLYDGDFKKLRWDIMKEADFENAEGKNLFYEYYGKYEFKQQETVNGVYSIKDDAGSKEIKVYNADVNGDKVSDEVVSITLNNSKFYPTGTPYKRWISGTTDESNLWHFWPHLLIEQDTSSQPVSIVGGKLTDEKYDAGADRIFVEFDIKFSNLSKNYNSGSDGTSMSFMLYSYLRPKSIPGTLIWFGMGLADDATPSDTTAISWGRDSGANTYMYFIPEEIIYGGIENSLSYKVAKNASDKNDWVHVKLDLTPHIDKAIEWATAEDAYGLGVTTKDDWFFNGLNIGYECQDNVDATVELANFNFYSYNAK